MYKIKLKRLVRRLKMVLFAFRTWEYESCCNCGGFIRFHYDVNDKMWKSVCNQDACLCLDCFAEKAIAKGILLKIEDFQWIDLLKE